MNFSPYLQAIQQIPGKTSGEKHKSLGEMVKKIADQLKGRNSSIVIHLTPTLGEALIPLVRLQVAKTLRKPEEIVEALKSNDLSLFSCALKCKWFFNGSCKNFTNASYFMSNIFPHLSLSDRAKIIGTLAKNLNPQDPAVAEEFYEALTEKYGNKQGEPLLLACRDTFIWTKIETHCLALNIWTVKRLYPRNSKLIVNYLKLIIVRDAFNNNMVMNLMIKFRKFLPNILKCFPTDFIEIMKPFKRNFGLKINPKRSHDFCKNLETFAALFARPEIFFHILSRKVMTRQLTKDQFKYLLVKLLPNNPNRIPLRYDEILQYIKDFPEEEGIILFLEAFEERYGIKYLECEDAISPAIIIRLPEEMRIDFARTKIKFEEVFNYQILEESWVCYLPIREGYKIIREQIKITSNSSSRCKLLVLLIYLCHVNKDLGALRKILRYITTTHQNEDGPEINYVLVEMNELLDINDLSTAHWDYVMNLVDICYERSSVYHVNGAIMLVIEKIFFDLMNQLPVDEDVDYLFDLHFNKISFMDLMENHTHRPAHIQKQCLDSIIRAAPSKRDVFNEDRDSWFMLINDIVYSIYCLNNNCRKAREKVELKYPRNYDWLLEEIRSIMAGSKLDNVYMGVLESTLGEFDPELYIELAGQNNPIVPVDQSAVRILKKSTLECTEYLRNNWEAYYEQCKKTISYSNTQYFIKSCRWHQDIPIKFVEKALEDLPTTKNGIELVILALLVEGKKFEEIIEPFISTNIAMEFELKEKITIMRSIFRAANVGNNPLSSEIFLKYFNKDYLPIVPYHLKNFTQRSKSEDILRLAEKLMEKPNVSIKKHGMRLFFTVVTLDQQMQMLEKLTNPKEHRSIRYILATITRNNFINQPNPATFEIMCKCIENMPFDDDHIVRKFMDFRSINSQFIADYFKVFLAAIENSKKYKNSTNKKKNILAMIKLTATTMGCCFSEEYHQELLKKYFASWISQEIIFYFCQYIVENYIGLAGEKLQLRLNFFFRLLKEILINNLNVPDQSQVYYPANLKLQMLTECLLKSKIEKNIKTKFVEIISEMFVLINPIQIPKCYMMIKLYNPEFTSLEAAEKIYSLLPNFVDIFSIELIEPIGQIIFDSLKYMHDENFDVFFSKIVDYLLEQSHELTNHLYATWLVKGFFSNIRQKSYLKVIQALSESTNPAVLAQLSIHRANNSLNYQ